MKYIDGHSVKKTCKISSAYDHENNVNHHNPLLFNTTGQLHKDMPGCQYQQYVRGVKVQYSTIV